MGYGSWLEHAADNAASRNMHFLMCLIMRLSLCHSTIEVTHDEVVGYYSQRYVCAIRNYLSTPSTLRCTRSLFFRFPCTEIDPAPPFLTARIQAVKSRIYCN